MSVRLFIGNLPYGASEADLKAHFATVTEPSHVVMPVDRETGRPRGFAFVEFVERAAAEEVIRKFDAQPFMGRNLAVSEARAREDRPPGGGFGGPRPGGGGFSPRPGGGGFGGPRPASGGFGSGPSGPSGSRNRAANFGPPAPPKRLRGKKGVRQEDKPKGPIKERSVGRTYALDDLEESESVEFEDLSLRAPGDEAPEDKGVETDADTDTNADQDDTEEK